MVSPPPPGAAPAARPDRPAAQSALYKAVMTPIVFVSFLVSLAWVEFRYSLQRSHQHDDHTSRMPRWLHRLLYRRQPYRYVLVRGDGGKGEGKDDLSPASPAYYHSMQRKLLRMESAEAFRIRPTVLCVLGLAAAVTVWAAGMAVRAAVTWVMAKGWHCMIGRDLF